MMIVLMHEMTGYEPIFECSDDESRFGNEISVFVTPTQDKFQEGQIDVVNKKLRLTKEQATEARKAVANNVIGNVVIPNRYLDINGFKPIPKN